MREPKTRNTAARHQALRLDQPQLVRLVTLAFRNKASAFRLWPLSPATFRSRFAKLLAALHLDKLDATNLKALDLGSLRAGGATWLLQTSEDGELVRRRGRWINSKVMEIYIQEVSAVLFLPRLPQATRDRVLLAASTFPAMLAQAEDLVSQRIPESLWFAITAASRANTCTTAWRSKSESWPKWSLKLCRCKAESVNVAGLKDALPPHPPARGSTKVQTLVPLLGGAKASHGRSGA